MSMRKFFQLMAVATLLLTILTSSPILASPPTQGKGPGGVGIQSTPTEAIENEYIKTLTSAGGRFIIGTTGGDPGTPDDNNKRLLFGYPTNVGSSFSTLRVINGGTTTDYRLGDTTWDTTGVAPVAAPTSDGTTIRTVWEISGVRVEERLYLTHPGVGWEQPRATAIEYEIKNNNTSSRDVGLRIMLDTQIGDNDGAPFFILGKGQLTQEFEFTDEGVPGFWSAFESPTFDPNSLKSLGQLSAGNATRPNRFIVAHWPSIFATDWDYTIDPARNITTDSAVALYYNPVMLGPNETKTYRTYYGLDKPSEPAKLELLGLEVTQGIQDLNNSVVLIEGKRTFVRAYVQSTSGTVQNVTAQLVGTRIEQSGSRTTLGTLLSGRTGITVDILPYVSHISSDHFYFGLPSDWLRGTVEFEFQGLGPDPSSFICSEPDNDNDPNNDYDCKVQVTFSETLTAEVDFVGIIWEDDQGQEHKPTYRADFDQAANEIENTFPISKLDWDYIGTLEPTLLSGRPDNEIEFALLVSLLWRERALNGCLSKPDCQKRYWMGIIVDPPDPPFKGDTGKARHIPSDVAAGYLSTNNTLAHELGHCAGRDHTDYNKQRGIEPKEDYTVYHEPTDGTISQNKDDFGNNTVWGARFYPTKPTAKSPSSPDLMSYGADRWSNDPVRWPSPWTYTHTLESLRSRYGTPSASLGEVVGEDIVTAEEDAVIVSGFITMTESAGEIESVSIIDSPGPVSVPDPGDYAIRLEDDQGQELATYSFELAEPTEGSTMGLFGLLLPWNASTVRIVLLHNGQELDSRSASANAPTVTVTSPNGGESLSGSTATLSWSANDPDGDPLSYIVQYSTDAGTSWQTLAIDWPSTTYELDLNTIPGTSQGLIRVLASDGFHTTQDQSDATFSVAKHPPQATIRTPEDNRLYVGGQTIILEGSAHDLEDGLLGDAALSWTSSRNGALGSGRSLAVNASTLAEGTHTITLTAQDSDGQTDTASIAIQIYRERPTLPTSLAVAPAPLSFIAREDSGQTAWQTLSIRNDGDGTMTWSAVADQSWILTSSLGGTAPTDIIIAADPTGLSIGEYTGRITITAPGAGNSPQAIQVTLNVVPKKEVHLPVIMKNYTPGSQPPNNPPYVPSNPTPDDGDTDQSVNVDLSWTGGDPDPGDTVTYDVYFEANDSTPDVLRCNDVTSALCDPGTLSQGTHYYWQVVARDSHGATTTGPVWDFTTATPTPPTFIEHTIDDNFDGPRSVYATDVDGDGDVDVLGAAWHADDIAWWQNDGSENFTRRTIDDSFDGARTVYATDVDGDGDVDVVGAAWFANDITWWQNDGNENFTKRTIDDNFDGALSVHVTDVDGDGDVDVLGAAWHADDIAWWENDGSGNFAKRTIADNFDGAISVYATDVDGDGDVDVLGAAQEADDIAWWENDGNENFTKYTIADNFDGVIPMYATDVDSDGEMDVLSAAIHADDITWWENDGNENFTEHTIADNFDGAYSVYATDVDGDGDVDVLGAATWADDITWWENDASENFTAHTIADNFDGARAVYATDVDGDGDVDVLGAADEGDDITWWEQAN